MSADNTIKEKRKSRRRKRAEEDEALIIEEEEEESGLTDRKGRATRARREIDSSPVRSRNIVFRFIGGVGEYVGGVRSEIEKVSWPTRPEIRRLTLIVLATVIASAIALGIIIGLQQPIILMGAILIAVVVALFFFRRGR